MASQTVAGKAKKSAYGEQFLGFVGKAFKLPLAGLHAVCLAHSAGCAVLVVLLQARADSFDYLAT